MTGAEPKEATEDSALPGPTSEMPEPAAEQKAPEDSQPEPSAPPASQAPQELPPGFLYKVFPFFTFKSGGQSSFLCVEALRLKGNLWFPDVYFYFLPHRLVFCTAFLSLDITLQQGRVSVLRARELQ